MPRTRNKQTQPIKTVKVKKPTFVINVNHEQSGTWQGSIQWLESGQTSSFRSILEMLKLMEQAQRLMGQPVARALTWQTQPE